jgi:major membrane immunogen (membrane-anchored lipoprotein)
MGKISIIVILLLVFFSAFIYLAYSQLPATPGSAGQQTKTVDANKDGATDVTYYSDGKYVSKIEADSNYDGKPDITVNLKDGKFESAEADTDYDGKPDKKFSDVAEFNKWLNENNPDFQDKLNRPDWQFDLLKF